MDNIELYCGDCLDVMKAIPDNSINLVLIDPPYNIGKDKWDKWKTVDDYVKFMGKVFKEIERILKPNGSFYFFHNDFLQIVELQNWLNKNTQFIFKSLITWNKTNFKKFAWTNRNPDKCCDRNWFPNVEYILYYTFQDDTGLNKVKLDVNNFKTLRNYSKGLQDYIGLKLGQINKILETRRAEHFFYHSSTQWDLCTEEVYNLLIENFNIDEWEEFRTYESLRQEYESLRQEYESLRYTFNLKEVQNNISCVWEISEHNSGKLHSCQKPLTILEKIIKTSSNENDVVLDCFMGSGSTGVACKHTNRKFIGIEVNEKYFDIAKKRIEEE